MKNLLSSFFGALMFYTTIALPEWISVEFIRIARWLPWVGLLLAGILVAIGFGLQILGFAPIMVAIFLVGIGIYLTGGLHLDGVMDTADGLAVQGDKEKQLEVMRDSRTGAFGVMAAIVLLSLKIGAMYYLENFLSWGLVVAMSWSRWGQLIAIARYDYLRKEGKGAFLKENLNLPLDLIIASFFIFPVGLWAYFISGFTLNLILKLNLLAMAIALFTGWWFDHQLGGHTGDTYGATVEWSEALILSFLTLFV